MIGPLNPAVGGAPGNQRHRRALDVEDTPLSRPDLDSKHGAKSHRRSIWQQIALLRLKRRWGTLLSGTIFCLGGFIFFFVLKKTPDKKALRTGLKATAAKKNIIPPQSSNPGPFEPTQVDRTYGMHPLLGSVALQAHSNGAERTIHYPAIDLTSIMKREEAMAMGISPFGGGLQDDDSITVGDITISISDYLNFKADVPNRSPVPTYLAVLTRRGYKGGAPSLQVNQDRIGIHTSFGGNGQNDFFLGLFDGHGEKGHIIAHYALLEMPKMLEAQIQSVADAENDEIAVKQIIDGAFVEIDRTVPLLTGSGCTAHTITRIGDTIYAANAGDSRILLASHIPSLNQTSIVMPYTSQQLLGKEHELNPWEALSWTHLPTSDWPPVASL
jgi:hypothetical protein